MMSFLMIIQKYLILTLIGEQTIFIDIVNAIKHHNILMSIHLINLSIVEPFNEGVWCIHDCITMHPIISTSLVITLMIIAIISIHLKKILTLKKQLNQIYKILKG